jgi:hypothetical protein
VYLVVLKQLDDASPGGTSTPSHETAFKTQLSQILDSFPDVLPKGKDFKSAYPPERVVSHEIPILPGKEAPHRPAYRMSQAELEELRNLLRDLVDRGLIQTSTSPYGALVLLIPKKTGGFRLVIDYRSLYYRSLYYILPPPPN